MELSIEKVYALASKHPEIKVLLEESGANLATAIKLRGKLAFWRLMSAALGVLLFAFLVNAQLVVDNYRDKASEESVRLDKAELNAQARKEVADAWRSVADEQAQRIKQLRDRERASDRLAWDCMNANPKWLRGRP